MWENLSAAPILESTRIVWFRVIQDLIPTNERLQRIRMVQTDTCRKCTMKDTLEHRITACGEGSDICELSKGLIAQMLRTTPSKIPNDWFLHPQFRTRPATRHRAILWTLEQVILFRTQQTRTLILQDFMDFLQRSRWKFNCSKKGETVWATISQSRIRAVGESANKTDEEQQDKCEPPTRDITIAEFCNTGQKTSR